MIRDGIVLGTTEGTSFFDDTRAPGEDYTYTLVAIAADGQRSDGGVPNPGNTGDGQDDIRADNVVTLIAAAFDAYRGQPWGESVLALPGFPYSPNISSSDSVGEEETIICDNGGTATVRSFWVPAGRSSSDIGFEYTFVDCQDDVTVFDGQVEKYRGRWRGTYVRSSGMTVTRPTETIRYSGAIFEEPGANAFSASESVDFDQRTTDGSHYAFTQGRLRVSAPDGTAVVLDADNGDSSNS